MVRQEHEGAGLEVQVDAPGGVGEDKGAHAQLGHHPHGQGDLLLGVALVVVDAAPQGGHGPAPAGAQHKGPLVSLHRGQGEAWDVREGDDGLVLQPVAEISQAAAQDEAQLRYSVRAGADGFHGPVDAL